MGRFLAIVERRNKRYREEEETPQIKIDVASSSNFEISQPLHHHKLKTPYSKKGKKENILHLSLKD